MFVCGVDGHGLNEVCPFSVKPDWNDDEFGKFKVWRCGDKFGHRPERRREVLHDACDVGVGDDFDVFVEWRGAGGVRYGLIDE